MNITAIVNTKGGVGKTITSVHLGAALATAGKRTLLIDMDLQHGLTSYFDVEPGEVTMANVLRGDGALTRAILPVRDNLWLIPATSEMEAAEASLTGAVGAEIRLRRALKGFISAGAAHDFILIDCPSGWGNVTRNALLAAESMLIPVNCDQQAARGATATAGAARELSEVYDHSLLLMGLLLTCWRETNAARAVADDCADEWGDVMFKTRIRRAEKISELTIRRQTLSEAGKTPVGDDYAAFAREFIRRAGGK